jgi:hypothetical protein
MVGPFFWHTLLVVVVGPEREIADYVTIRIGKVCERLGQRGMRLSASMPAIVGKSAVILRPVPPPRPEQGR